MELGTHKADMKRHGTMKAWKEKQKLKHKKECAWAVVINDGPLHN